MSKVKDIVAQADKLLRQRKLRNTKARNDILQVFLRVDKALSKNDIESHFKEIDRITLYRTLKIFEEKGIIHEAIDGTATPRYALCEDCDAGEHMHHHAHFHCKECGSTYCIDEIAPPDISAVKRVKIQDVELVLKGICENCMAKG